MTYDNIVDTTHKGNLCEISLHIQLTMMILKTY